MANSAFSISSLLNQQSDEVSKIDFEGNPNNRPEESSAPNKDDLFKLVTSQFAYYQSIFQNILLKNQSAVPCLDDATIFPKRIGHPYVNRNPPKRKKPRTSFNRNQLVELEKKFLKQKYLASSERSVLARALKMTDGQVKTWFQNRRTKWRRQSAEEREVERQMASKLILNLTQSSKEKSSNEITSVNE